MLPRPSPRSPNPISSSSYLIVIVSSRPSSCFPVCVSFRPPVLLSSRLSVLGIFFSSICRCVLLSSRPRVSLLAVNHGRTPAVCRKRLPPIPTTTSGLPRAISCPRSPDGCAAFRLSILLSVFMALCSFVLVFLCLAGAGWPSDEAFGMYELCILRWRSSSNVLVRGSGQLFRW